jgi:chromosome segregation ATPase
MKHDVSNIIKQANERGLSCYRIAKTAGINPTTVRKAMVDGRMVNSATCNNITRAICILDQQARESGDVAFNQGHEVSTATLAANLEKQVEQLRDTVAFNFANVQAPVNKVDGLHPSCTTLVDDQIESAGSREKAELQTALVEHLDQITALEQKLRKASEQAQSSLAELTKANKRIACQSENIEIMQHQLSAERVSYNDKIERLQSDLDLIHHEYTKAQHAITDRDTRITQITKDKVSLSHERARLQSRAEVFKITAFTFGALWLVALFCLIVILVG